MNRTRQNLSFHIDFLFHNHSAVHFFFVVKAFFYIFSNTLEFLTMHQDASGCPSGCIKKRQNASEHVSTLQNASERVKPHQNASVCVRKRQNMSKRVKPHHNASEHVKMRQNASESIKMLQHVSERIRTRQNSSLLFNSMIYVKGMGSMYY